MLIIYGTRMYGRVDECGGSYLATCFVHLWYLPVIPTGSHLVVGTHADGSSQSIPVPLSWRSVMAAYMRFWGIALMLCCLLALAAGLFGLVTMTADQAEHFQLGDLFGILFAGFFAVVSVAAVAWSWLFMGKLSAEEKRKRELYAQYTGIAADPADLQGLRLDLRQHLLSAIDRGARGLASTGYRVPADPAAQWGNIALDPTVEDPELIGAAFTLARIEWSLAQGGARAELDRAHRALWHRIGASAARSSRVAA